MVSEGVREEAYQESYQRTQMQKDIILEKLREKGCRITRQRQMILDIILEEECSCCKEICYKVQKKDKRVGTATVYRMVNMMEQIGAISRKNMYRITDCGMDCEKSACVVKLSDGKVCSLGFEEWKKVMGAGLKDMGYIAEQDIESMEVKVCKNDK